MSATTVGKPGAGQKVLRRRITSTEVDGLVSISEVYTVRSASIASIEPDRNTPYNTFVNAEDQNSSYSRMQVETTRIDPMDGDLVALSVTYVGLDYPSGLPPAYITTVGQPGAGIFGADASIVVRYVTDSSLFDTLKGGIVGFNLGGTQIALPTKRLLPASINGTTMPPNPRRREYRRSKTRAEQVAEQNEAFQKAINKQGYVFFSGRPPYNFAPEYEWIYAGYVQTGISFQRRGMFNQIEEQFTEYFRGSDVFYTTDGAVNTQKVEQFSSINTYF